MLHDHDVRRPEVDDVVLALLHVNASKDMYGWRAWMSFDWSAVDRLHERELISDPNSKAQSEVLTDEGVPIAVELFAHTSGATPRADRVVADSEASAKPRSHTH